MNCVQIYIIFKKSNLKMPKAAPPPPPPRLDPPIYSLVSKKIDYVTFSGKNIDVLNVLVLFLS